MTLPKGYQPIVINVTESVVCPLLGNVVNINGNARCLTGCRYGQYGDGEHILCSYGVSA